MFDHGFPSDWSTLKKLIWVVKSTGGGGSSGVWKTVSGSTVHVTDALANPLKKLEVEVLFQQSGSGDPTPNNVRPLSGWTACNVYHSGADTSVYETFHFGFPEAAGTVYFGTLTYNQDGSIDFVKKGECVDGGNQAWVKVSDSSYNNFRFTWAKALQNNDVTTVWSSHYKGVSTNNGATSTADNYVRIRAKTSNDNYIRCTVKDTSKASLTAAQFKTAMEGVQFAALYTEDNWTTYHFEPDDDTVGIGYADSMTLVS